MRNSKSFLFIGFAALTLAACGPQKEVRESPKAPFISSLSEKAADCESKIVQQMKAKSLFLQPMKGLEKEILTINDSVQDTQDTIYQATKLNDQVSNLSVEHNLVTDSTKSSIEYRLSPADKHTSFLLQMSIYATNLTKSSSLSLTQNLGISEKCEFVLSETEMNDMKETAGNKVSMLSKTVYSDGDIAEDSKEIEVPEGKKLANFFNELTKSKTLPKELTAEIVSYIPKIGLADITLNRTDEIRKAKEFGLELNLEIYKMEYSVKGQNLGKAEFGVDSLQQITVSNSSKSKNWTITEEIFNSLRLGSVVSYDTYVKSELSEDYLSSANTIEIVGEKKPTYKYFAAYWKLLSQRQESDGMTVFTYQEMPGTFKADSTAEDLKSNSTIQTELPEIKRIAATIRTKAPSDRKEQIRLILRYLKDSYSFDHEMAKNNTVRPLTTQEALKRGKGVCQHYAVIFVSIARALNIPSATVTGYSLLGGSAGGHAWVEAEIEPRIWQVIEPQQVNGLEATSTRFYIPTGRQGFLEDKEEMIQFIKDNNDNVFTIRPVSN